MEVAIVALNILAAAGGFAASAFCLRLRKRLSLPLDQCCRLPDQLSSPKKNMTNSEIAALAKRIRLGGVWWHDDDNRINRVRTLLMDGTTSTDTPEVKRPVVLLMDGRTIALDSAKVSEFVTLQPAVLPGT